KEESIMRALVASPSAPEHIEMREVPDPSPAPNEALVRVRAISLNRGEVNRLATADNGTRFGWDIAGTVERPAANGEGPTAGARVVGFAPNAGWAEHVAVPANRLAEIPADLSFEAASALPVAGITALRMIRIDPTLGKRVLITGAAGGVGRFAVQLAARGGAHVTGVVGSEERGRGLRGLGAMEVLVGLDAASPPYDIVLDSVGGSSLAAVLGMVSHEGLVVVFGNSSQEDTTFRVNTFYFRHGARMQAFSILAPNQPQNFWEDLAYLADLAAHGELDVQIDYVGSWEDAAAALAALRERRIHGKAVLQVE
ncbi:MAG TPA: zinc-binding dehydrogenase, partial [Chloroflexota bacterium]